MSEFDPAGRVVVASWACPPLRLAVPSRFGPLKNWTVPVAAVGLTVAVSVTDAPARDGLGEVVSAVVVAALTT